MKIQSLAYLHLTDECLLILHLSGIKVWLFVYKSIVNYVKIILYIILEKQRKYTAIYFRNKKLKYWIKLFKNSQLSIIMIELVLKLFFVWKTEWQSTTESFEFLKNDKESA